MKRRHVDVIACCLGLIALRKVTGTVVMKELGDRVVIDRGAAEREAQDFQAGRVSVGGDALKLLYTYRGCLFDAAGGVQGFTHPISGAPFPSEFAPMVTTHVQAARTALRDLSPKDFTRLVARSHELERQGVIESLERML
jgi:hypothetical protein